MSETEAYFQIALILGIILCLPLFWRVGIVIGKLFIRYIFPPKYITITFKQSDGSIEKRKVEIGNSSVLINTLIEASEKE